MIPFPFQAAQFGIGGSESDPHWPSVVSSLSMDGANNGTSFPDAKGKTWTAAGNAVTSTAQSKWGGSSGKFDGTGDYISTPNSADYNFGTGNATFEAWIYIAGNSAADADGFRGASICNTWSATALPQGWSFAIVGDTTTTGTGLALDSWNTTLDGTLYLATTTISQSTWHHVAGVVSGGTRYLFLDGVLLSGSTTTVGVGYTSLESHGSAMRYGNTANTNYPLALNGYIDSARITKGVARMTASFSVPTGPYPSA